MSKPTNRLIFIMFLSILVIVLSACSGLGNSKDSQPTEAAVQPTQPLAPTEEQVAEALPTSEVKIESGALNSITDAKQAVIQIEAQGSFTDPQVGQLFNTAGRGSGFIIDPSGLAVTNNHVVTGAALLKVWVGGDQSKSYNAKVLGVSECSDLALIDIEGEGFPYMNWANAPADVGTEIYVAGFPLGDPEYSLSKGIISKAKANGETNWASVDSVIEYDATTNPGNSGGPVLTEDAQVVGVHYSGNAQTRQAFGISSQLAKVVVEQLKQGKDLDSIGINGQVVSNEDGSLTGIWVSSVKSGSPADKVGLQGGDIILTMENLILGTDGSMANYCDILRSHTPNDLLNLEVLRFATGEILEGQLNGRQLAVSQVITSNNNTQSDDNSNTQTNSNDDQTGNSGSPSGELNLNASASGDVYYASDFDTPLTDWVYFLMSGEESGVNADVTNSKLHIEINKTNTWVYFYLDALDAANVRLDTKVENLGRNTNNVSLICRYTPDRGWYEFNVANNGLYTIFYYDAVTQEYISLFSGGSNEIKMGKGTNELTAICQGNTLTLGINGVEVRTINDDRLTTGKVGLSLSSFDIVPIVDEFDYFITSVP
jgi:S1-C subfamily serine protease